MGVLSKLGKFLFNVFYWVGKILWFLFKIPYFLIKNFFLFFVFLYKRINFSKITQKKISKIRFKPKKITPFGVLKTLKGEYFSFFENLKESDSFIALVIGARGAGKTAVSLSWMELLMGSKDNYYAMGFSKGALPDWITLIDEVSEIENNSLVVVDEGGILFSSRKAMSSANSLLSDLLMIARHKNISIIFISQNSSNLEVNTLRQADVLILKKHSLLQKSFERKIVAKLYEEHEYDFQDFSDLKGATLVYADSFVGFVDYGLPSFWSTKASKSFKDVKSQGRPSKNVEK